MRRMLFLYNLHAGKGQARAHLAAMLEQFTRAGWLVTARPTQGKGDAGEIAAELGGEFDRIVCCGGDGTLNEVVNGAAGYDNAAVTNVPKGTGNDFIKLFGPTYRSAFSDLAALAAVAALYAALHFLAARYRQKHPKVTKEKQIKLKIKK